uniref:translation initiation factor IF-3 n=1 Tax=Lacisediminihabitans sp. TaxID=2787631 RepID=UPI00374DBB56
GVVRIEDAIRLAQEADLDLVEVAPNSKPPVAKIMDFGKFKYETAQKAKEAKRNQSNTILKEVRFRLKIDVHDYETKRKRAEGFLQGGDKVKAMILFRGREQSRPEQGVRLLQRFAEDVSEFGTVESTPTIDGRNMVMVIGPLKTKAEVKAEHDAKIAKSKPERAERPASAELPALPPELVKAATDAAANPPVAAPVVEAPVEVVPVEEPKAAAVAPKAAPVAKAAPAAAPVAKAAPAAPVAAAAPAAPAKAAPAKPAATEAKPPTPRAVPSAPRPTPTPGSIPKPRAVAPKTAPADVTTD